MIPSFRDCDVCEKCRMPSAVKVFDVNERKTVLNIDISSLGLTKETEFIDAYNGKLYYADRDGEFFELTFND